jgi:hypothetical protein
VKRLKPYDQGHFLACSIHTPKGLNILPHS